MRSMKCVMPCTIYMCVQIAIWIWGEMSIIGGCSWWRHQMKAFSVLLVICAGNSPVTSKLPAQRPVMRSFDLYFDLRRNEWLSKQWWGWWFETPSRPLWRHGNVYTYLAHGGSFRKGNNYMYHANLLNTWLGWSDTNTWCMMNSSINTLSRQQSKHQNPAKSPFVTLNGFPSQIISNAENVSMLRCHHAFIPKVVEIYRELWLLLWSENRSNGVNDWCYTDIKVTLMW